MFVCKSENILLGREVRTILMTKHLPSSFISVTSWIYLGRVHCCCQDPNLNKQPNGISSRVSLLISCWQLYIEYTTKTKIEDLLNLILINKYYFSNLILMRLIFCSPTLFAPKVRRWSYKLKKKSDKKKLNWICRSKNCHLTRYFTAKNFFFYLRNAEVKKVPIERSLNNTLNAGFQRASECCFPEIE